MQASDPVAMVASLGGIALARDVRAGGVSKDAIQRAVVRRTLLRPRHGIVALPTLSPAIRRAAAAGGALAGLSAAEYYGFWTPSDSRVHISARSDSARPADQRVVVFADAEHLSPAERFLVSRQSCVRQCIRFLPFPAAVAVLDSALHLDHSGQIDLARLREQLPRRLHAVLDAADHRAESGAESIARVRLAERGIVATPQRWVTDDIRVDLLIGDRLVVEIGSEQFHAHPDRYEADHRRAAMLLALGCDMLEFTTRQVMDDWDFVASTITDRVFRQRS